MRLTAAELLVVRGEIRSRRLEELLEVADHEVGLLEGIDLVARLHDPQQVEADAVGAGTVQAVADLAAGGEDPRAVGAQPLRSEERRVGQEGRCRLWRW